MAFGSSTVTDIGGAVSDLFAGLGAGTQADLKAKGLGIQAQSLRLKALGDITEGQEYDLASALATKNKQFTETSTAIQQAQLERQTTMQIGGQRADVAGAGFAESGSALDILRDSASQGALAKAVLGQQGLITEEGYQEQANSYNLMASTARATAAGEQDIANQTDQLAQETRNAGKQAALGDFISAGIKGAAAIGSVFTGGFSIGDVIPGSIGDKAQDTLQDMFE